MVTGRDYAQHLLRRIETLMPLGILLIVLELEERVVWVQEASLLVYDVMDDVLFFRIQLEQFIVFLVIR